MWTVCADGSKRRCHMWRGDQLHLHQGSVDQTIPGVTAGATEDWARPAAAGSEPRWPRAVQGASSRETGPKPLHTGDARLHNRVSVALQAQERLHQL